MEEKEEVKYLSLDDCKKLVYGETKMIAMQFMGTFNMIDVFDDMINKFLSIFQILIVLFIAIYGAITDKTTYPLCILVICLMSPMIFLFILIFHLIRNKKQKEMDAAKVAVAIGYFSKTKEFTQEDWVRDKIFETEIEPYIQ